MKFKRVIESTNTITEGIINILLCDGWSASRINTQGQWVKDKTHPEGGYYRPSGARKGYADISACISGRPVAIEIKFGDDEQSEDQIEFQKEWERAGGIYIIVKKWAEFLSWYEKFKQSNFTVA